MPSPTPLDPPVRRPPTHPLTLYGRSAPYAHRATCTRSVSTCATVQLAQTCATGSDVPIIGMVERGDRWREKTVQNDDTRAGLPLGTNAWHGRCASSAVTEPNFTCIVVSRETEAGGEACNRRRLQAGMGEMEVHPPLHRTPVLLRPSSISSWKQPVGNNTLQQYVVNQEASPAECAVTALGPLCVCKVVVMMTNVYFDPRWALTHGTSYSRPLPRITFTHTN